MKNIKLLVLLIAASIGLNFYMQPSDAESLTAVQQTCPVSYTNPLDIVARPNFYLNKNVRIKAKFDKFSTLGLDYKPAMRSSEKYISFLIQRPDITDHNIPLSELKIFLTRTEAEKYIELNSGDTIEFDGKVFSNALGDAWLEVNNFKVLSTKPKENK